MTQATLSSMTGFARAEGALGDKSWVWEMKSVNGKGLEMRFRVPPGSDELESNLRKLVQARLKRGSVSVSLALRDDSSETQYRINPAALDYALDEVKALSKRIDCAPPSAEAILNIRGVMEASSEPLSEEARAALKKALTQSFEDCLDALAAARAQEGAQLAAVLEGLVADIEQQTGAAASKAALSPANLHARLKAQLDELLTGAGIAEERLAQEAALLAVKADIREEIDRLKSHIAAARELLAAGQAVGRRLDFLTQEFNREANTLCAKAPDMEIKAIGLALKQSVDQLREQVQNVE